MREQTEEVTDIARQQFRFLVKPNQKGIDRKFRGDSFLTTSKNQWITSKKFTQAYPCWRIKKCRHINIAGRRVLSLLFVFQKTAVEPLKPLLDSGIVRGIAVTQKTI